MSWWVHNLKHKELYERYNKQEWEKSKRTVFSSRVLLYWYTREQALLNDSKLSESRLKRYGSELDENWRVCRKCWIYKTYDMFSKNKAVINWYTSTCKECRNKYKAEYRARTDYKIDRLYKKNKRHLKNWEQIYFQDDIRTVIDYKIKKWYTVKSVLNWTERIISTSDNHYRTNNNCVRFRKLNNILIVKTNEELEEEKKLEEEKAYRSIEFLS